MQPRELSLVLCADLEGWDVREAQEGGNVCIQMAEFILVQQKLTITL